MDVQFVDNKNPYGNNTHRFVWHLAVSEVPVGEGGSSDNC
jgi:hypothetical protein